MSGKGSKPRPYKVNKFCENFDAINWNKIKGKESSTIISDDRIFVPIDVTEVEMAQVIKDKYEKEEIKL